MPVTPHKCPLARVSGPAPCSLPREPQGHDLVVEKQSGHAGQSETYADTAARYFSNNWPGEIVTKGERPCNTIAYKMPNLRA
jgi:hypothetical protein